MVSHETTPMTKLIIPSVSSGSYKHSGHEIEYSPNLVWTGKNPTEGRVSTADEELAIQLGLERAGIDPRQAKVFDDLFARNKSHVYIWQRTETSLRVPKGYDPNTYQTDDQGRKYWVREVLIGDNVVGEVLVPEGHGRVVPYSKNPEDVWDMVFGLPRITSDSVNDRKYGNHTTHFGFNENPWKDNTSGHKDVAVWRGSGWLLGGDEGCLVVGAPYERWGALSYVGFRPVRGSLPDIGNF